MIGWNQITRAANELTASGFKLFLYIARNADGYKFDFNAKHFKETFNLSDRTYRNARQELFEKGYLIEKQDEIIFNADGGLNENVDFYKNKISELGKSIQKNSPEKYNQLTQYIAGNKELQETKARFRSGEIPESAYVIVLKELLGYVYELINGSPDFDL